MFNLAPQQAHIVRAIYPSTILPFFCISFFLFLFSGNSLVHGQHPELAH